MSFARYFRLSSFCLIASGFTAIAATGSTGVFWGCLYGSALVVSCLIDTDALKKKIPVWLLNTIVLGYLPIAAVDYALFSRSFVFTVIHLVLFVAALKLLTLSSDRDHAYLYAISFAQLLAASTLTIDITFAFALFTFLISGVSTLVLFEMRRSSARVARHGAIQMLVPSGSLRGGGLQLFARFPAWHMTMVSLAITLLIILLAVPLFVMLPRITTGLYSRPSGRTQMISGFSERVELGRIGAIKESDAVVMRVRTGELPATLSGGLKWRGIALDYYDGRTWNRSRTSRVRIPAAGQYFKLENSIQGTQLLEQTFFLEALSTDVVFACHKVLAVSSDLGSLRRDSASNLYTMPHSQNKIRYRAVSDITPPDPEMIPRQGMFVPEEILSVYLQVPGLDPRIAALAGEVTRTESHPFEKANRIERYLKNNYAHSLDLRGTPNSKDPLAMFLFDVRKGHCEYFASAMTIMLRDIGIPARLVNGFRCGEYNRLGDSFTVRQYDAHSWVEAWFEPYGWVEFDPTPPAPRNPKSAMVRMVTDLVDAIGLWWWEGIVNFDAWKQVEIIRSTRSGVMSLQRSLRQRIIGTLQRLRVGVESIRLSELQLRKSIVFVIPALILCAGIFFLFRLNTSWAIMVRRFSREVLFRKKQPELILAFYRDALDLLRSSGIHRNQGQTPLEFASSLACHPAGAPLIRLTNLYNQLRFGPREQTAALDEAEQLLKSLRSSLRRNARRSATSL